MKKEKEEKEDLGLLLICHICYAYALEVVGMGAWGQWLRLAEKGSSSVPSFSPLCLYEKSVEEHGKSIGGVWASGVVVEWRGRDDMRKDERRKSEQLAGRRKPGKSLLMCAPSLY